MRRAASIVFCVIALSTFGTPVDACKCPFPLASFTELLDRHAHSPKVTLVVLKGTVTKYGDVQPVHPEWRSLPPRYLSMNIKVESLLTGVLEQELIKVWGGNGVQCFPPVITFPLGSEWIFIFVKDLKAANSAEYVLGSCGEYWLRSSKDRVSGRVTKDAKDVGEISFEHLQKLITQHTTK